MFSRTVRTQLVAFVVIALLGVSYLAVRYVGLDRYFGASGYTVKVDLASSGGIFTNASVSYRGVPVGRVGDMRLTRDGIQIDLDINSGRKIPADVKAVVADMSVVGEQYVDLQPNTDSGPYLGNGSVIPQSATALPPPVQELLLSSDQLVQSVPIASLQTVVSELYDATNGAGEDLGKLIKSSNTLFTAADKSLAPTLSLINTGASVLKTQQQESDSIKAFSANLALIGQQLKDSNGDISKVLSDTAPALDAFNGLVNDVQGSLGSLLSNLLTTSIVFQAKQNGLQRVLVQLPVVVGIGGAVITPQGMNVGLVPTFFDPMPCTQGYEGTKVRTGLDTSGNPPLNTAAGCTSPPSSGIDLRGTQNGREK